MGGWNGFFRAAHSTLHDKSSSHAHRLLRLLGLVASHLYRGPDEAETTRAPALFELVLAYPVRRYGLSASVGVGVSSSGVLLAKGIAMDSKGGHTLVNTARVSGDRSGDLCFY